MKQIFKNVPVELKSTNDVVSIPGKTYLHICCQTRDRILTKKLFNQIEPTLPIIYSKSLVL